MYRLPTIEGAIGMLDRNTEAPSIETDRVAALASMFDNLPKFVSSPARAAWARPRWPAPRRSASPMRASGCCWSHRPGLERRAGVRHRIGNRITPIAAVPGLEALEIDPEAAAAAYRDRIVGPLRGVLPEKALKGVEEQLSGACTTEIAAFDEFTALLTDDAVTGAYDHIIFDTAPTGHTIRLLKLPGAWSGFLETGGDASCLGPLAGLEKQRARYAAAVESLSDAARTRLILVARPRASSLAEAARTSRELAAIGIANQHLAINGIMPEADMGDALAASLIARDRAALDGMDKALAALPQAASRCGPRTSWASMRCAGWARRSIWPKPARRRPTPICRRLAVSSTRSSAPARGWS
jgi:TRC40/GET3/ArsA family transport-energizing ATPase